MQTAAFKWCVQGGKNNRKITAGVSNQHFDLYFLTKHCCVWSGLFPPHPFISLLHPHMPKSKHTLIFFFYLIVTRCQQEQVEGTLPHAEPSVCCCLSPYHARYTAYQCNKEERSEHSLRQFGDNKYDSNTCEKRDHSQDIRQRLTVKQQNN